MGNGQTTGGDDRSAKIITLRWWTPSTQADRLRQLALKAGRTLIELVVAAEAHGVELPVRIRHAATMLQEPQQDPEVLAALEDEMKRRDLLRNIILAAGTSLVPEAGSGARTVGLRPSEEANERVLRAFRGPGGVDVTSIADMEAMTAIYRRSYRQASVRTLLPLADGQVGLIRELSQNSMRPALRDRLTATAGEATALVGVMLLMDMYAFDRAWPKLTMALKAAQEARANELEAFILGCMAFNAGYDGRRAEAINLITRARRVIRGLDAPRTRGWLAAVEGELRARSHKELACLKALEEAQAALDDIARDDTRPWIGIGAFDEAKLKGYYGACYLQLKKPDKAVEELTGALEALDPVLLKHRCTALADLATGLIHLGEIEEGCRQASQSLELAIELRHAVSIDRIRDFDRRLAPWASTTAVKAFREQLVEQLLVAFYPPARAIG